MEEPQLIELLSGSDEQHDFEGFAAYAGVMQLGFETGALEHIH